jgi:hypothetical protein
MEHQLEPLRPIAQEICAQTTAEDRAPIQGRPVHRNVELGDVAIGVSAIICGLRHPERATVSASESGTVTTVPSLDSVPARLRR